MALDTNTQKMERVKRGTIPPYLSLSDAFALVREMYGNAGAQASTDLMSRLLGNSSSSSSFSKKIGSLRLYNLVNEQNGVYLLTDIGTNIAAPQSEESGGIARKSALLSVPQFAKLFERFKAKLLPADEFLKNILEQENEIPREFSDAWSKAFKDALKACGLLFPRSDGKLQVLESPMESLDGSTSLKDDSHDAPQTREPIRQPEIQRPEALSPSNAVSSGGNSTRFKLSDGRVAEFCIPFGISNKDAVRLKNFLKGLEFFIDSAVIDEEEDQG